MKGYGSGFVKDWNDYKVGFGSPEDNVYWIGLDRMHELTSSGFYYLEVKLKRGGQTKTLKWTSFSVGSESNKYRLSVSGFDQGTSGLIDELSYHSGMYFSTHDRDNDDWYANCSNEYGKSGWWFKSCKTCDLNYYPEYNSSIYDESTMILKRK